MIKIKYFLCFTFLSGILWNNIAFANDPDTLAQTIYHHALNGNLQILNQMKPFIDTVDQDGNTALCQTVLNKDYKAFSLLKQMGANTNHTCIHKIAPKKIADFNQGYSKANSPKNYRNFNPSIKASALSTTSKVGIGLGIAAAVGGGIALAGGGGGGGSSNENNNHDFTDENQDNNTSQPSDSLNCPANTYAQDNTCMNCPQNAISPAGSIGFNSCQCISGFEMQNNQCIENTPLAPTISAETTKNHFLTQINALSAYEKGYTGYIINQDSPNSPSNNETENKEKIKIGVWDSSFDVKQPDLIENIATRTFSDGSTKTFGLNTQIGPCKTGDNTNCYGIEDNKESGNLVWYDNKGNATLITQGTITMQTVRWALGNVYSSDYDWDDEKTKYNVTPKSTSVNITTNIGDDHGTHVAGIIGATNNGIGMHGVVPDSELYLATWTNNNYQNIDQYYAADFFANSDVRIVNASFGTPLYKTNGEQQIKTASEFSTLSNEQKENALSLGERLAYQTFAENDIVLVKAVGNDGKGGQYEASYETSVPMVNSFNSGKYDMTNLFIAAIAVDKNNKLSSYSQYCGANAKWCLAAPGGDYTGNYYLLNQELTERYNNGEITQDEFSQQQQKLYNEWGVYSTVSNDNKHQYITQDDISYGYMTGTSVAAPIITSSVGLLMSAYPHLTSQEVVEILFRTANKNMVGWGETFNNGYYDSNTDSYISTTVQDSLTTWTDSFGNEYKVSKIYGHGMVDLDSATQPLGDLKTPITNSTASKTSLSNTKLALPRFVNSDVTQNLSKTILALDDYDRPFPVALSNKVQYAQRNTDSFKTTFKSFLNPNKIKQAGVSDKLNFAFSTTKTDENLLGLGIFDMNYQFNEKSSFKFSYRSHTLNEKETFDKALANPFINMTDSYSLNQELKYQDVRFSFGASVGKNAFFETDEEDDENDFNNSVRAFDTSVSYTPNKSFVFKAIGGMMQEKDALLGMNGTGVFDTNDGTTYYTGAYVEYKPTLAFTLSAGYYYGLTQNKNSAGLIKFSNLTSDSFALDARYQPDNKNTFGVQFSSPLRIKKGNATFNIPVARDLYEDIVYFDKQTVSLKSQAREYDLGFYYIKENDKYDFRNAFTVRFNPDHIKNAKPDYRAILGLSYKY